MDRPEEPQARHPGGVRRQPARLRGQHPAVPARHLLGGAVQSATPRPPVRARHLRQPDADAETDHGGQSGSGSVGVGVPQAPSLCSQGLGGCGGFAFR